MARAVDKLHTLAVTAHLQCAGWASRPSSISGCCLLGLLYLSRSASQCLPLWFSGDLCSVWDGMTTMETVVRRP